MQKNILEGSVEISADLIMLAHEHKKIVAPPVIKLGLNDSGNLIQKKTYCVMIGSFLRGYVTGSTTYVEKKGYPPSDLGITRVYVNPKTKDIHAQV